MFVCSVSTEQCAAHTSLVFSNYGHSFPTQRYTYSDVATRVVSEWTVTVHGLHTPEERLRSTYRR